MMVDHRLLPQDPMAAGENRFDQAAARLLLDDAPVTLTAALEAVEF